MRSLPVRVRVTLAAALVGALAALAGAAALLQALAGDLEQSLLETAGQESAALRSQLAEGEPAAELAVPGPLDRFVQVVDAGGRIVAQDHPGVAAAAVDAPGRRTGVRVDGLDDSYAVSARRTADGGLVVVGLSEERRSQATAAALRHLAWAIPAAVALLALVVWVAVGRALAPVERMRREADTITSEHLHRRLPVPAGDDEIRHLALTLNEMLGRIEESQEAQRQFVADASHELRSPLAILRQQVEVARRHPDATTVVDLAAEVGAGQQRMEGLVAALLTLARLDDGSPGHRAVVDLDDLVLTEAGRLRRAHPDLTLDLTRLSGGQVRGDAVLLAQVVANLVGNAARHAATLVAVEVGEHDDVVHLRVGDDGAGVVPSDRERIFERFTRLDEARSRDRGGAGLGLAIVRRVVEQHGGTVTVHERDGGGAVFDVRLPGLG